MAPAEGEPCWAEQKMHRWAAGRAEEGRRPAGPGPGFCPPQGLWVCALSLAPLKAFLALDLAQFLQQDGPATPLHPRPLPPRSALNAPSLGVPARRVEVPVPGGI